MTTLDEQARLEAESQLNAESSAAAAVHAATPTSVEGTGPFGK